MVEKVDLYELLDISPEANEKEIRQAYRRKALKCHPDKNPDDPKAVQLFHRLSEALELLTDNEARRAYDNVLKARKAASLRNRQLDAKRRKLKDELERRERKAEAQETEKIKVSQEDQLFREIERLRKQGSKQLEEEQELMRQHISSSSLSKEASNQSSSTTTTTTTKLKLKWKDDPRYDKDSIMKIFSKYGDIVNVVVLSKAKGKMTGLVEMDNSFSAKNAANIEMGFTDNPLKVKLLDDGEQTKGQQRHSCTRGEGAAVGSAKTDFETLVMRRLRQEEERKRLIKNIIEQDAKDSY